MAVLRRFIPKKWCHNFLDNRQGDEYKKNYDTTKRHKKPDFKDFLRFIKKFQIYGIFN